MLRPMNVRGLVAYSHDIVMTALSFVLSLYLRLGADITHFSLKNMAAGAVTLSVIGAIVYWYTGLYRGIWRYASVRDLTAIVKAVSLAILLFLLAMFVWSRLEEVPRSLPLINWLVLIAMLGGPRLAYRIIRDRSFDLKDAPNGTRRIPVLLAGASDGAELFIRSLSVSGRSEYRIAGIVSEKSQRVGQQIHGVPILDTLENLPRAVEALTKKGEKPQRLILTKDTFDGGMVRHLFNQANELGLSLARVPDVTEFKTGDPDQVEIRPIDVEDLLGRPQTSLDRAAMKTLIAGKRVLVTGAGGSIGSELVRQIAAFGPAELDLLDNSEYALYQIDQEVSERFPDLQRLPIIADVRDVKRIEQIFAEFTPELVFHAAALKHVPLVEDNCCEGAATNVLGTVNVAEACIRHNVDAMVQISTDKAINPTNVMGATKRVAEQYAQALDLHRGANEGTNFVTVRFGNVLGSTGSVVPLFQRQLANGGPLTVTHPDMTRYFMTIREAVELILLASTMAHPGADQDGKIFVLDMGEPVRIMDLAQQMIRLAGKEPDVDVKIDITGLRPGEKLFEEIFHDGETFVATESDGILLAAPRATAITAMRESVKKLEEACALGDDDLVRRLLSEIVPEAALSNGGEAASEEAATN